MSKLLDVAGRKPGTPKTGGRQKTLPENAFKRQYAATDSEHVVIRSVLDYMRSIGQRKPVVTKITAGEKVIFENGRRVENAGSICIYVSDFSLKAYGGEEC